MKPECLNKTLEEIRECSGGGTCCVYDIVVRNNYCDKGGHKERSMANSPNHAHHWKKNKLTVIKGV